MQNPSFFDLFKRRSDIIKHTFVNNKDLTLDGLIQFEIAKYGQDGWLLLLNSTNKNGIQANVELKLFA